MTEQFQNPSIEKADEACAKCERLENKCRNKEECQECHADQDEAFNDASS